MKIAFYTLGCKVNQYETQAMEQLLRQRGHTLGAFEEVCDAYIINTCTVTAISDKKSRNAIRRARRRNPDAVIAVAGCYAQVSPDEIRALGVDVLSGSSGRIPFLDAIERAAATHTRIDLHDDAMQHRTFEQLPAGGLAARTRALLKVEDGCVNFCTYCKIPYARGPVRSLPLDAAVRQARELAAKGYREIVVNGIEISSWGMESGGKLTDLLAAILEAVPELRIRLGSLEPRTVDEDFCRTLSPFPNLCPHFHLSLQSGCNTVLMRMRRKYTTGRFAESCRLLREYWPGCAITTDLIVGFPGETEAEFASTLDFIRACAFSAMHIFPYSRRKGTPAAAMPAQIPPAVKAERAARAAAVAGEMERAYRESLIGTVQPVLFEQPEEPGFAGHTPSYVKVYLPGAQGLHNTVRPVRIESLCADGVSGSFADE